MKRNFKKAGLALMAMTLVFVSVPVATNAMSEPLPEFISFSGDVVEITEGTMRVEREDRAVVFQKTQSTHILGDITLGDQVTGFWASMGIMTMQYPPHHIVRLIANNELGDAVLDRFHMENGLFVSSNRSIALNFGDDTPILLEDGQNVREILEEGQTLEDFLEGRLIAVTYTLLNRMMPGGTIPADPTLSITVMFETAVHPIAGIELDDFDFPVQEYSPEYTYIEGTVTGIRETLTGNLIFETNSEGGVRTNFVKDHLTFVQGQEISVGDTIQTFFDISLPIPMIYPAQHVARVIVNKSDDTIVGNTTLITAGEDFIQAISDDIPVHFAGGNNVREVLEEGQTFEEVLQNRTLAVTHDEDGNLLSVVVLYVRAVQLPGMALDLGLDLGLTEDIVFGDNPISVENVTIDAQWQEIDGAFYVPLRAIVEALNPSHTILWDNEARAVLLNNGIDNITVTIGSTTVTAGGNAVELTAPAILIHDHTYVPFNFFNTAFGVNNAWMHAGQVFIDNQELMQ